MKLKNLLSTLFFSTILLTSCGGSDDDGIDSIDALGNSYFTATVGDKEYKYPSATTAGSEHPANTFTVMVLASAGSNYDSNYGIYNGGALSLTCTLQGEGEYTITNAQSFVASISQKLITVGVTLGTGTQIGYRFDSQANSGKANVTIEDGKYHITISNPITLKKSVVTSTPTETIPETIKLTVTNGYVK